MARTRQTRPTIDMIADNAPLIREYIERGETFLGVHPKSRLQSFRVRLTNLRTYAYHHIATDSDPDGICSCAWLIMRSTELDYEDVTEGDVTDGKAPADWVRVYWRPDRIMAAREKAGLPVVYASAEERTEIETAKKVLLDRL